MNLFSGPFLAQKSRSVEIPMPPDLACRESTKVKPIRQDWLLLPQGKKIPSHQYLPSTEPSTHFRSTSTNHGFWHLAFGIADYLSTTASGFVYSVFNEALDPILPANALSGFWYIFLFTMVRRAASTFPFELNGTTPSNHWRQYRVSLELPTTSFANTTFKADVSPFTFLL